MHLFNKNLKAFNIMIRTARAIRRTSREKLWRIRLGVTAAETWY